MSFDNFTDTLFLAPASGITLSSLDLHPSSHFGDDFCLMSAEVDAFSDVMWFTDRERLLQDTETLTFEKLSRRSTWETVFGNDSPSALLSWFDDKDQYQRMIFEMERPFLNKNSGRYFIKVKPHDPLLDFSRMTIGESVLNIVPSQSLDDLNSLHLAWPFNSANAAAKGVSKSAELLNDSPFLPPWNQAEIDAESAWSSVTTKTMKNKELGPWEIETLASYDQPLAHEGILHLRERDALFFTSNRLIRKDGSQYVTVSMFDLKTQQIKNLDLSDVIPMANGAFLLEDGLIAIAMQGNKQKPAGVASYNLDSGEVKVLTDGLSNYQFNSPNDIVQSNDTSLWFTDPQYGYEQGFRPKPDLGNWVWRISREGKIERLLMDGFSKPNGIAFNKDETKLFITDTGDIEDKGLLDNLKTRTIYRFSVIKSPQGYLVSNGTAFAVASKGVPDGIKVDSAGRVWTGTGAGLEIFSSEGELLQIIPFEDGVSNFALNEEESGAFVMGENKIYRVYSEQ